MRLWAVALALAVAGLGCGEPALKGLGDPCVAASECGPGLVCDLVASPPVCAGNVTGDAAMIDAPAIDGPPAIDALAIDAPAIDAPIDAGVDAAIDAAAAQGA